jgi:hypothetical protein
MSSLSAKLRVPFIEYAEVDPGDRYNKTSLDSPKHVREHLQVLRDHQILLPLGQVDKI